MVTLADVSISLDGFMAGPDQSMEQPLGLGGYALHPWHIEEPLHEVDARWRDRLMAPRGATVMGRNMFGPVRGPWAEDEQWRGWWGEEPPYHSPVFVLTHFPREPVEMEGGTTFYFVGDLDEAFTRAREAAGDQAITVAGGASTLRQALQAGYVDELRLTVAPVLLGRGERPLDGLEGLTLEQLEVEASPLVAHLRYRVTLDSDSSVG